MMRDVSKIAQLSDIPKENVFRVPEAYFEHLSERVLQRNVLGLNEMLLQMPFVSPDQYFETLEDGINSRIDLLEGLASVSSKGNPFKVPEQYFDQMASELGDKVLLPSSVASPLALPEDYFDALESKIYERIEGKSETKVVALYPQVLRYAVAASVVLVLSVAWYFYKTQELQSPSTLAQQPSVDLAKPMIASLSKQEVRQYLEQQDVDHQDLLEYASVGKKQKIQTAFEKELLPGKIKEQEREDVELELDNIDIADITSDI